jgi:hypothetical protein
MRWIHALLLCLALPATPAAAQCRLCPEGAGLTAEQAPAAPIKLELETSLDFDQLVLTGAAGGTVRLGTDGSRTTSGAVGALSPRAMFGELLIRGEAGRSVRVSLPERIELFGSGGGTLVIHKLTTDLPALPRLDSEGRLRLRFGGELSVSGGAEGDYRGDIAIAVDYL